MSLRPEVGDLYMYIRIHIHIHIYTYTHMYELLSRFLVSGPKAARPERSPRSSSPRLLLPSWGAASSLTKAPPHSSKGSKYQHPPLYLY